MRNSRSRQACAAALGLMVGLCSSAANAQAPAPVPPSAPASPPAGQPVPQGYYPPANPSGAAYPAGYPAPLGYGPAPGQPVPPAAPGGYPPAQTYPPPLRPAEPVREPTFLTGSVSAGLGIPYGVLGGAVNFGMDYVSLMAGGGSTVVAGAGYAAGLRVHFLDTGHKFRPHLTAVYGTTAAYKFTGAVDLKGTLRGFAFYAGLDHDVGQPGDFFLTYGIGYITHEDFPASVKRTLDDYGKDPPSAGTPIKFMFACGYRFGGK